MQLSVGPLFGVAKQLPLFTSEQRLYSLVPKGKGLRSFTNMVLDNRLYSASQRCTLVAVAHSPLLTTLQMQVYAELSAPRNGLCSSMLHGMLSEQSRIQPLGYRHKSSPAGPKGGSYIVSGNQPLLKLTQNSLKSHFLFSSSHSRFVGNRLQLKRKI